MRVVIELKPELGAGAEYQFECLKNEARKIGLEARLEK